MMYLRRAVGHDGEALERYVIRTRDNAAARASWIAGGHNDWRTALLQCCDVRTRTFASARDGSVGEQEG
ncbi:hypothetical protein [Croceicoccus sp. YJ47]|uniref:hypothetical protein n=1 Tax=Croceicoccus sp. YJ47 TaxID=2798724 RepID=UPI00352FF382